MVSLSNKGLSILRGFLNGSKAYSGPITVGLMITNHCNVACRMCPYHSDIYGIPAQGSLQELNFDKIKDLLEEFRFLGVRNIVYYGEGEPLLHSKIQQILELTKNYRFRVELVTNGLNLNPGLADLLLKVPLWRLIISLHSGKFETFSKIRPSISMADYNVLLDNIGYISKNKSKSFVLVLRSVITKLNFDKIPEIVNFAKDYHFDEVEFIKPIGRTDLLEAFGLNEKEIEKVEGCASLLSKSGIKNNFDNFLKDINVVNSKNSIRHGKSVSSFINLCYKPWTYLTIRPNGDVLGCYRLEDFNLSFCGNVYKDSLGGIWNGQAYQDFRRKKFCPIGCVFRKGIYMLSDIMK